MKMIEYLYVGFLLLSLLLLFFAYKQYYNTTSLISKGIKTKATVIDLIEVSSSDGYSYRSVFEFTDRNNKRVTFENDFSSRPASHELGEVVTIIYDLNSEKRKEVSFWGLYRWTIVLLCIAAPLMIIGGGYLLYAKT